MRYVERLICFLSFALPVLVALCMLGVTPAEAGWTTASFEFVTDNTARDETERQSLAIDNTDALHAVWRQAREGGGWKILYAAKPIYGPWTDATEVSDPDQRASDPTLAINESTGDVYVAYCRPYGGTDEIIIAENAGAGWIRTRLTENTTDDISPTIAVDDNGKAHLAWIGTNATGDWKIFYATNLGGTWQSQLLADSQLGTYGSGAGPFIAVGEHGVAHIAYRGGNYLGYHIHHAENDMPGGATWDYEIILTPNVEDTSGIIAVDGLATLHLIASGNDSWGCPVKTYYLQRSIGLDWTVPVRANPTTYGSGFSLFVDAYGSAHITCDEISGNFYMGNLYYATNATGTWEDDPILADGQTYHGTIGLDSRGVGHVLAFNGASHPEEEIIAIHSTSLLSSVDDGQIDSRPLAIQLHQGHPNPFDACTTVRYELSYPCAVSISIHDVSGQLVRTLLANGQRKAGAHSVRWDGTDEQGRAVDSGVYLCRLRGSEAQKTKRMILLK
ncbi:MAG: T9SS type A sorting domain-containing protein [Candidatus Eisenbacteria sp.]|nr:T9SS type A sorting domain-containing protein [Candidatus Eisenbacteria bacterium]